MDRKKVELILTAALVPLDLTMITLAFSLAYFLRVQSSYSYVLPFSNFFVFLAAFLPLWIVVFALAGLYNFKIHQQGLKELLSVIIASSASFMFILAFLFATRTLFFSRLVFVYAWLFSIVFVFIGRILFRIFQGYLYSKNIGVKKVILIGDGSTSQELYSYEKKRGSNFRIVGVFGRDELMKIKDLIHQGKIDEIIQIDPNIPRSEVLNLTNECDEHQVDFKYVPSLFEIISTNVEFSNINSIPLIGLKTTPLDGWGRIAKRVIDIVVSSLALIISSPFFIIIPPIIKITSPGGPIFFRQKRVGRDGKEFKLIKFRSMRPDAEKLSRWTTKNDSRITPFGKFIRATNLDEIPQFLNVFVGNMSIIGPRPEQPLFVEKFSKELPDYAKRHKVKSGITGWAQVSGLRGDTSIAKRVKYDLYYIENWSLSFDLLIMLKTVGMILRGKS